MAPGFRDSVPRLSTPNCFASDEFVRTHTERVNEQFGKIRRSEAE